MYCYVRSLEMSGYHIRTLQSSYQKLLDITIAMQYGLSLDRIEWGSSFAFEGVGFSVAVYSDSY